MKLSLGFSPCPNDTFIFDALVNRKIDTEGLEWDVKMEDVETLNEWALEGKLDITKLSFPAFFQSSQQYRLVDAGSALGKGVGPLLVARLPISPDSNLQQSTIALPGIHTTANLLFSFAYPQFENKKFMLFSEIEDAVVNKEVDLGVIIHENRFTYQQKGLNKVLDLGEYWETKMNTPIPLGGIAAHHRIDSSTATLVSKLIRKSIEYAFEKYPSISDYVKAHSQSMSEEVMRKHIELYVNNYSLSLGQEGRDAIHSLFTTYRSIHKPEKSDITSTDIFHS